MTDRVREAGFNVISQPTGFGWGAYVTILFLSPQYRY